MGALPPVEDRQRVLECGGRFGFFKGSIMAFLALDSLVMPFSWFLIVGAGILFVLFLIALGGIIWLVVSNSSKSDGPKDAPHLPPCPMCGASVSPNAVSCPHCGEPLGTGGDDAA